VVGSTGIGTVGDVEVPGGILADGVIEGEKVSSDTTLGTDGMLMSSTRYKLIFLGIIGLSDSLW
jgi:hypothetical protein